MSDIIESPSRSEPLRIVFMGTPAFAATVLSLVARWEGGTVVAAYAQPDRPAGRGHKLQPPAVKVFAASSGIPVYQPLHFRDEADRAVLAALKPDVLVVAAYGLLLPQAILDLPRIGPFNVHASLLPRYRGAAPIQRAIMAGEPVTGITIMRMELGLDSGPVVLQKATGIAFDDTAATLHEELAHLGGQLMVEALERLISNTPPKFIPQDHSRATHAAKLSKADGIIDWNGSVASIHARICGVTPWPGAHASLDLPRGSFSVSLSPGTFRHTDSHPVPGTISFSDGILSIACSDGWYSPSAFKPAGGRFIPPAAFWNGYGVQKE